MSVTVNIYYTGADGKARSFAEEMVTSGTVDAIRAAEGNLRYEYFFPMDDGETLLLIDTWTDQAAIDRHHASPMMAKIAQLRDAYDLHMKVERYISDEGGAPAGDERFIRR
ncbi:antibiotic biosynthesis monooxygenase [Microbacterium sp. Sa4CUA7]|uniref:Antibiotic biosynthesis monooxygenase n=1 Tax=Microbacterium pullorum TaxID=2762236 RepID=A0ABR8RZR8_9MICO|nr:putative quinol monooxygenase [Microbacterium pullorum]MBD7956703.1 antibiotic biosynthesis monooxygenase [Microbacterium pullorum]